MRQVNINQSYKAAVITEPGKVALIDLPLTQPGSREILIKTIGCGLCASSLPVWEGRTWFSYPLAAGAPGHEGWGTVEAVGDITSPLKKGDLVAFLGSAAFAEYALVPVTEVVKLPSELTGVPFPGEPLGCALNVFKRSDIFSGQTVCIIGCGFLGLLLIQLCKAAGAKVIALSKRPSSLAKARENGADHSIALLHHHEIIDEIKELTDGVFCDRVIECTGVEWPLNLAGELCKIRGKLIIAGYHQDGMRQLNVQLWNWRGIDIINAHERDPEKYLKGIRLAAEFYLDKKIDHKPLLTHAFDFSALEEALNLQLEAPEGFTKGYVQF